MTYRAAIVGCGNMGGGGPDSATGSKSASHAAAYRACAETELVAVCDTDRARLDSCGEKHAVKARYLSLERMLVEQRPDILSVCTPSATHNEVIRAALSAPGLQAILAEKPLAIELGHAHALVREAAARHTTLAVNYSRRYAPGCQKARTLIGAGGIGRVQAVTGYYTKGVINNGTHWFDLAHYLVGPVAEVRAEQDPRRREDDPTLDVTLVFADGAKARLCGCDADAFSIFEMDIIGTAGRISIRDSGHIVENCSVGESPHAPGYRVLQPAARFAGDLDEALVNAVADLVRCLGTGTPPLCSGEDAARALEISLAAVTSAKRGDPVKITGAGWRSQ